MKLLLGSGVQGLLMVWCIDTARAEVTLPFSTTYDCAEQQQFDGLWVTCDGLGSNGDWTTSNGSKEQITSAANYPGGGGGRGQRHWIGQSIDNTNGSGSIAFDWSPRVQEIYVRWYVRWQAGLKLGFVQGAAGPRQHKLIYFNGDGCGSSVAGCVFDVEGGSWSFTVAGTSYNQSLNGNSGWDGLFGGAPDSNVPSDGRWIMLEIHLLNETGGANNGRARLWADGVLQFDQQNLDMKGSDGFSHFSLPENHQFTTVNGSAQDMYEDIDDVAIRTTGPIGPLPTASAPPAAPTNLKVVP